jgi:hypothetical protein
LDIYRWENPQIDHILIDWRRHLKVLDVPSFRAAYCDTGHYLAVTKVRERLAVIKQKSHRFLTERFSLKTLNVMEGKEKYRVEVPNRFAALEDLDTEVDFNSAWETIIEHIQFQSKRV